MRQEGIAAPTNSFSVAPVIYLTKYHQFGMNNTKKPTAIDSATVSIVYRLPIKIKTGIIVIEKTFQ